MPIMSVRGRLYISPYQITWIRPMFVRRLIGIVRRLVVVGRGWRGSLIMIFCRIVVVMDRLGRWGLVLRETQFIFLIQKMWNKRLILYIILVRRVSRLQNLSNLVKPSCVVSHLIFFLSKTKTINEVSSSPSFSNWKLFPRKINDNFSQSWE